MRAFITLCIALAAALGASTAPAQSSVDQRRPLGPQGSLRIYNLYGSITVLGWDRDTVAVTGTISRGERVLFGGSSQGLKLGVESDEERTVRGAHLVIHVPAGARVWVKTASAEMRVSGITGGLDLYSVGASMRVTGSPRELSAEAMDGAIDIDGSPAWLRAKTATGDITLHGSSEDAGFSSVSGMIKVSGGKLRRGAIASITGDVSVVAALPAGGALDVDAHGGRVEIVLPPDDDAAFDVVSIAGSIRNEITTARPASDRSAHGTELHFATRAGSPRVAVRTFKGEVLLRRP